MRVLAALPLVLVAAALATSCADQDVGSSSTNDEQAAPADDCGTEPGRDEAGLVGLSEDAAEERVEGEGLVFRVVCLDGKPLIVTADARADRVNAGVKDGVVTFTWRG